MRRKHCRWISLIAMFGILAVMLSWWAKDPVQTAELDLHPAQKHQLICTGASSSLSLAEFKPKLSGIASGASLPVASFSRYFEQNEIISVAHRGSDELHPSQPLWLLKRALLI